MKKIFLFISICLFLCNSCQDNMISNFENQEFANAIVTTRSVMSFSVW